MKTTGCWFDSAHRTPLLALTSLAICSLSSELHAISPTFVSCSSIVVPVCHLLGFSGRDQHETAGGSTRRDRRRAGQVRPDFGTKKDDRTGSAQKPRLAAHLHFRLESKRMRRSRVRCGPSVLPLPACETKKVALCRHLSLSRYLLLFPRPLLFHFGHDSLFSPSCLPRVLPTAT